MQFLCRPPAPPLDGFIERLWLLTDPPPGCKERIAASETVDLMINLREDRLRVYSATEPDRYSEFSGAVISGTRSGPCVIDTRELVSVAGVHFRPGGAFPFLGVSALELADRRVDLEALWGTSARELRERMCLARTASERLDLLEHALLRHLFRPLERHHAVRFALDTFARADSLATTRDIARAAGLSQRRLIELFAREVGMAPKLFHRLGRFRKTLEALRRTVAPDWARLALDCGFYDQSHLIHDFQFFSNLSPTEFLRLQSGCVMQNHATLIE